MSEDAREPVSVTSPAEMEEARRKDNLARIRRLALAWQDPKAVATRLRWDREAAERKVDVLEYLREAAERRRMGGLP